MYSMFLFLNKNDEANADNPESFCHNDEKNMMQSSPARRLIEHWKNQVLPAQPAVKNYLPSLSKVLPAMPAIKRYLFSLQSRITCLVSVKNYLLCLLSRGTCSA